VHSDNGTRQPRRLAADRISDLSTWAFTVAVPLGVFIALAAGSPRESPASPDARLTRYIERFPDGEHLVTDVFAVALHPAVQLLGGAALLAAAVAQVATRRRWALFVVLTILGALILEPVLKDVIQRPPVEGATAGSSFPSGHALRSMAGAVALILLMWHTRFRWPIVVSAAFAVAIVGVAIVHEDWHWASDVLGGWCLGGAWVALLYLIIRPARGMSAAHEPVPASR
jgi:membrane-associated phospholipid phosphatase